MFRQSVMLCLQGFTGLQFSDCGSCIVLESFLKSYPDSRFVDEARVKMAPFVLAEILGSTDIETYEDFLERFPEGPSADTARKTLELLRSEQETAQ